MFSFGFVLLHPAEVGRAGLTTTNQQTAATSHTDSATASLPPIPLAPTTLPTLTPVPQTEDASQAGNTAHETATPQVVGTASPAASRSLQAAGPSGQSISSNKPINTRMSLPTPLLTNLFRH